MPRKPTANKASLVIPPGAGDYAVPHIQQFVSIINGVSKAYRNPDEAVRHSAANARAMRRDPVIMQPLLTRQMTVAEESWQIEPENKKDPAQVEACRQITRIVERIPFFTEYKRNLLEAVWYGRYAVENLYGWDFRNGRRQMVVKDWIPCHGDSLVYKWSTGEVGLLVGLAGNWWGEGTKQLTTQPTDVARAHFLGRVEDDGAMKLLPHEREAFVIHSHFREAGSFSEPESSGAIHGRGLRSYLYWIWYLKHEALSWLTEYLERQALGMTIWYFERGNEASEKAVRAAAEAQSNNCVILFPREVNSNQEAGAGLQRIEPSGNNIDGIMRVIDDYWGGQLNRMIIGQNLSSESAATGLGSGVADLQESTLSKIIRYDATSLQETLTRDLVRVLTKYNYPNADLNLRFVINCDKPEPEKVLQAAKHLYDMGAAIDEDELRGFVGLSTPDQDSRILKQATPELVPSKQPDDKQPDDKQPEKPEADLPIDADTPAEASDSANSLRATVGGSSQVMALQQAFYEGKLPREAVMANLIELFGFDASSAARLLPEIAPKSLTQPPAAAPPAAPQPEQAKKFEAGFDETKHPRKGGQFAPKGQGDKGGHADGLKETLPPKAKGKLGKLAAAVKAAGKSAAHPVASVTKAGKFAADKVKEMHAKYGTVGTGLILGAAIIADGWLDDKDKFDAAAAPGGSNTYIPSLTGKKDKKKY